MKRILFVWSALVCCLACQRIEPAAPADANGGTVVGALTLQFQTEDVQILSRAADDPTIKNLNIYLFNNKIDLTKHYYLSGPQSITIPTLPAGTYELYAVANEGTDMGEQSPAQLDAFRQTISAESDIAAGWIMSARQTIQLTGPTTVPVKLVRTAAKINLSVSIPATGATAGLSLVSVQLESVPRSVALFGESKATTVDDTMDYPAVSASGQAFTGSFYMLENKQGTVTAISDPKQKDPTRAPAHATRIHITAQSGSKKIDYFIYPGANTTSDFNIDRNRQYNITVNIQGANTYDWRVSTADLYVSDFDSSYEVGATATADLRLTCYNNAGNTYTLTYRPASGSGTFKLNGQTLTAGYPVALTPTGGMPATVAYTQSTPGNVSLQIDVTDKYGYTITKNLNTEFKKFIRLTLSVPTTPISRGQTIPITVTASEPIYTGVQVNVYCNLSYSGSGSTTTGQASPMISFPYGQNSTTYNYTPDWNMYYGSTQVSVTSSSIAHIQRTNADTYTIFQYNGWEL